MSEAAKDIPSSKTRIATPILEDLEFANSILGVGPTSPEVDIQAICRNWQTVTKADVVWLMAKNQFTESEPWEILAQLPDEEAPTKLTFATNNIAEYAFLSRQCVFADDLKNWKSNWANNTFIIPWKDDLEKIRAEKLDCIPLLKPIIPQESKTNNCPLIEGAIVLFHKAGENKARKDEGSLMVMGQLTEFAIFNSYQAEQRRILVSLNELAEKYLTRVTKNLTDLRREYLKAVIKLIQNSIHVEGVSVFYKDITETKVECLATTGVRPS